MTDGVHFGLDVGLACLSDDILPNFLSNLFWTTSRFSQLVAFPGPNNNKKKKTRNKERERPVFSNCIVHDCCIY